MSILQLTLKDLRQWLGAAIYSWWPMLLPTLFAAVVVACPAEADAAATHTATHAASHAAVASVTHAASQPADSDKVTQLDEVVIKRKRQKYSKKNNQATPKGPNDPLQDSLYSYDYYDKLLLGVNEYDIKAITKRNQYRFLEEYVDTAVSDHFPVMLLSVREKAGTRLYSQSPRYQKNIVTAVRSKGIDDLFDQKNINVIFDDLLRPIDIYDNDITLMSNRFVSPLSAIAGDVYKYFLNDTIHAPDGRRYLELVFTPRNPQSFGFNGRMFVEAGDSTYFVKAVRMRVPRVINLNYIDNIYISQDFELAGPASSHIGGDESGAESCQRHTDLFRQAHEPEAQFLAEAARGLRPIYRFSRQRLHRAGGRRPSCRLMERSAPDPPIACREQHGLHDPATPPHPLLLLDGEGAPRPGPGIYLDMESL